MTTFNWQGKEYKVVPDSRHEDPCRACCFETNMEHCCTMEHMYYPDGGPVQPCTIGEHHYEEVVKGDTV
jgi:hypothetical protein